MCLQRFWNQDRQLIWEKSNNWGSNRNRDKTESQSRIRLMFKTLEKINSQGWAATWSDFFDTDRRLLRSYRNFGQRSATSAMRWSPPERTTARSATGVCLLWTTTVLGSTTALASIIWDTSSYSFCIWVSEQPTCAWPSSQSGTIESTETTSHSYSSACFWTSALLLRWLGFVSGIGGLLSMGKHQSSFGVTLRRTTQQKQSFTSIRSMTISLGSLELTSSSGFCPRLWGMYRSLGLSGVSCSKTTVSTAQAQDLMR